MLGAYLFGLVISWAPEVAAFLDPWAPAPSLPVNDHLVMRKATRQARSTTAGSGRPSHPADSHGPAFTAYDCGQPQGLRDIRRVDNDEDCDALAQGLEISTNKTKSYIILQKAKKRRFPIKSCRVIRSRTAFYCGTYDHETSMTPLFVFGEDWIPNYKHCEIMWEQGLWGDGDSQIVLPNDTIHFHKFIAGWDEIQDYHVDCVPGKYDLPWGGANHGAKVTEFFKVTLAQEWAVLDPDGTIRVEVPGLRLPSNCTAESGRCAVKGQGTFLWDAPKVEEECPYYKVHTSQGQEFESDRGDRIFLSKDNAMLRLNLEETVPACGSLAQATDFPELFVTADFDNPRLQRELHPSEASTMLYVKTANKFNLGYMEDLIRNEMKSARANRCKRQRAKDAEGAHQTQIAEQMAAADGGTASLRNGRFATAAGEVTYIYQCKPLLAYGRNVEQCYDALPVELTHEDREYYFRARGIAAYLQEQIQFFLEPSTRRIVTSASPTVCSEILVPKYRDVNDKWYRVTPKMEQGTSPEVIELDQSTLGRIFSSGFNFAEAGLYPPKLVAAMEYFTSVGPTVSGVLAKLGRGFQTNSARFKQWERDYGRVAPSQILQGMPKASLTFLDHFQWLFDALGTYSDICSTLLVTYLIGKFLVGTAGFVLRLYRTPVTGMFVHVLAAAMPAVGEWFRDPTNKKPRNKKETRTPMGDSDDEAETTLNANHPLRPL